jgi:hypothetical protein
MGKKISMPIFQNKKVVKINGAFVSIFLSFLKIGKHLKINTF